MRGASLKRGRRVSIRNELKVFRVPRGLTGFTTVSIRNELKVVPQELREEVVRHVSIRNELKAEFEEVKPKASAICINKE